MKKKILMLLWGVAVIGGTPMMEKVVAQSPTENMKIHLIIKNKVITATLTDNPTTRDFLSLLPLTITMDDLFGREKYGPLPKPISRAGERSKTCKAGDIGYWSPGNEIAIYYKTDGDEIPAPGIIMIGNIDSEKEVFNFTGSVEVRMERR